MGENLTVPHPTSEPARAIRLLAMGGDIRTVPKTAALQVSPDPKPGFDIVLLLGPVDAAALWSALQEGRSMLAPVVDFSGQHAERSDVSLPNLTNASLRDALLAVAPILHRAGAIVDISDLPDRDRLYALGMAQSRQKEISAAWTPAVPDIIYYPLLGLHGSNRKALESLADMGLLERSFFGRANLCGHCGSSRVNVFEACGKCGSANLKKEQLTHHYPCGAQAPESTFLQGERLVCPKCRKELRHIGVDYDRPGSVSVCVACGEATADPDVRFVCVDCCTITPSEGAATADWFNYRITPEGAAALAAGRLPTLNMMEALKSFPGALSVQNFALVARKELRVAARYDRAFSLAQLRIGNHEALRNKYGSLALDESERLLIRVIAETLRNSDSVTATAAREIFIAFPETETAKVEAILARLHEKIKKVMALPLEVESSIGTRDEAEKMLEACR
ncbi:MAG: TackOD1 domain-containing metal-binding protein [Alphaproteobacteria bacterium]